MTWYFRHPDYTDGKTEDIGETETEAASTMIRDYGLEVEGVAMLCIEGHVWEKCHE